MQHTDKYKLNLIEKDDVFSPDTLNENAEKVESLLVSLANGDREEAEAREALESRVIALEAKKVVTGTYVGEGAVSSYAPHVISLGFTPLAVIVLGGSPVVTILAVQGTPSPSMTIVDGGFTVMRGQGSDLDNEKLTYRYIAFG